jgi:hypothetical protein
MNASARRTDALQYLPRRPVASYGKRQVIYSRACDSLYLVTAGRAKVTAAEPQVTQADLQRQFHFARQNAVQHHRIPQLSVSNSCSANPDLPGIRHTLAATRHLLEIYRRQLQDEKSRPKLRRLDQRLLKVAFELDHFSAPEN